MNVTRSFDIRATPSSVVEFLKDFTRAEDWDPGTKSCTRLDSGPVTIGSTWHNVSEFLGRETHLEYKLVQLSADRVVFRGVNKTVTSTDDITVTAVETGCRIDYVATLRFNGLARLAAPVLKFAFERLGDKTERQMTWVLNGLVHRPRVRWPSRTQAN